MIKPSAWLIAFVTLALASGGAVWAADSGAAPESPAAYASRAQWLRDAKLGVFLHWNPSSLIGGEISWCRDGYGREKYDRLYQQFKGEKFNADEEVRLFHEAGIRYAVIVPKHHDGFCMFDTKTSAYNVMNTPFGRDYVKEMADACAKHSVKFCLYYSVLDWWNTNYSGKAGADLTKYKNEVFKPHMKELLTHYGPVGYIWFDGNWEPSWTHADGREMYAYIHGLQPDTLLGNRIDARIKAGQGPYCKWTGSFNDAPDGVGDFQAREVDLGQYYPDKAWDCCFSLAGVSSKWSYVPPMTPHPTTEVVGWLIQCIGRDGGMLLGVGPRPDGAIDPQQAAALLELGDWMKLNGEAVYGTRGGPYLPGDWGVSTRKGNKVYLFVTEWRQGALTVPALPAKVKSVQLLTRGPVSLEAPAGHWVFHVPEAFHRPAATIIELTLDQDVMNLPVVAVPGLKLLSQGKPVTVSGEWPGREQELAKGHANDGDFDSIWAGADGKARDGWVQIDLGETREVAAVVLDDHTYERTRKFAVQAEVAGEWQTLVAGTTIGSRKRETFAPVKARVFRLMIQEATDTPVVNEFQLFGE